MKKIIVAVCCLILSQSVLSQEKISFDVFLDPKLAMLEDDHGNTPFTLNSLTNFSVQLRQQDYGYYFFGQSLEYADLSGGTYLRYSPIQVGYTFNQLPFSERLEASIAINYGVVKRWSFDFNNFGAIMDLSFAFTENIKVVSLMQVVRRSDIESPTKSEEIYRTSFFLGFRFNVSSFNAL